MVIFNGDWTPFKDIDDQLAHYRLWGLIPEKGNTLRPIMVTDGYFGIPEPCKVVGYSRDSCAIIELHDSIHAIHGEYLAELQPKACQKLPRGMCFADILSHYVVLDIETTGLSQYQDEIIELSAVKYHYGIEEDVFSSMVRPSCKLSTKVVELTGITDDNLTTAPSLCDISGEFLEFIGNLPVIGHNASTFDGPFLLEKLGPAFNNVILDTIPLAKAAFPLLNHFSLHYLSTILDLKNQPSHRALNDVRATNELLWASLAPRNFESMVVHEFLNEKLNASVAEQRKSTKKQTASSSLSPKYETVATKKIVPTCENLDTSHPLYNKNMVFTGTLTIPRENAMQMAVNCGAVLKTAVSGKTDYLVVGDQDCQIVGADGMSSKEEKAYALNKSGKAHITILCEKEFIALTKKEGILV